MTELVLKTEVREGLGKEANKKLRKLGIIPAVFYQKSKAQKQYLAVYRQCHNMHLHYKRSQLRSILR